MSEELLKKHQGPAEVEGFFDKLKHDYTSSGSEYLKTVDTIIYDYKQVKDLLKTRFLTDYQNSKKSSGIREVVEKYKVQYNIEIIPPSPRKPRPIIANKGKSPRKHDGKHDMFSTPAKKAKLSSISRKLIDTDADNEEMDMNTPFEQQLNKGAISNFSKSKQKRSLQRKTSLKTHKIAVDQKMEELDQKLDQERICVWSKKCIKTV